MYASNYFKVNEKKVKSLLGFSLSKIEGISEIRFKSIKICNYPITLYRIDF